jgi:hypothetical protein
MSVFGVFIGIAAAVTNNTLVLIGSMVFSIGFLVFLQYDIMFMKGLQDSVRNRDGFRPNKLEGLKLGLLSYAPTLLFALISIIVYFCAFDAFAIFKFVFTFLLHGSYNGTFYLLSDFISDPVLIGLTFVPVLAATTLGYILGLKDKPLRTFFGIPVKPPKPENQKTNKK